MGYGIQPLVTGSKKPVKRDYILHGQVLESDTSARYLGVDISGSLSWNPHVDRITGNANRTLGFVRRNIKTKMSKVRETAYNTLVRPQLEYASAVWDPHTKVRTSQIEQVQRRAARWTVSNYDWQASAKVSNGAKIRNRYNQVPHLTQDTNGKVTNSQKTPQTRAKRSALSQQVTTKHI